MMMRRLCSVGLGTGAALLALSSAAQSQEQRAVGWGDTVFVAPPTGESHTDRANVQAAFDAAQPGGTVRFAPGMYRLGAGARLTVPDVAVLGHPDGTVLRGCDPDAFEVKTMSDMAVQFACTGFHVQAERQTIRGLTFEYTWHAIVGGPYPSTAEEAAALGNGGPPAYPAGGQRIEGNTFRNSPNGLRVLGTGDRSVVRDNDFIDVFHAIGMYGAPLHFVDNRITVENPARVPFTHHPGSAVLVSPGHTDCSGHVIAGNRIEGHPDAIYVLSMRGETCRGVEIRDNMIRVTRVRIPEAGLFYAPTAHDSTMVGAPITLMNNARMSGMPEVDGEGVLEDVVVNGNRIVGAEGVGIVVQEVSNSRIEGNVISGIRRRSPFPGITWDGWPQRWESANGSGIWISPGSTGNEVVGNTFEDIAAWAVVVEGDSNRIDDPGTAAGVRDIGTGNRAWRSGPAVAAGSLTDPGPIWSGLEDTTAFSARMERHLSASEESLGALRDVAGTRTINNTILPFLTVRLELERAGWLAELALNTHPHGGFREHAQQWAGRISERRAAFDGDPTVYRAVAAVSLAGAEPGLRYVIGRTLDGYRRNGIDRSAAERERIASLRAQIAAVGTRFERNIFTDVDTLRLHPDSLAGMPADWLAAHVPDADGLVTIEVTAASAMPLLTFAERSSVRTAAFRAQYLAGYPANVPVVDSLRSLRHELATLLGYPSWAAYAAAPMMAKSPDRIRRFLNEASEASAAAAEREFAELLARRRVEEPAAEGIDVPSVLYWLNRVSGETYAFDAHAMREYLPYERVRDGILAAFAQLFALEFRAAPGTPAWSPAVEPYEVREGGELVGRFYLDMHPREGKFGHCGVSDLRLGGGDVPEVAMVCNLAGGTADDPGLLQPMDVTTFFHEFGHLVHSLFMGRVRVQGEVEWDFIEAPSQLLEAWAEDPAVLRGFARHYRTGEPIPEALAAAATRAAGFGRALLSRGLGSAFAVLSLELHEAPPETDPTVSVEARVKDVSMFEMPEGYSAAFLHLNLYSSTYYTYLWSAVIARDLLTGFDREDLLDPAAGRRYRDMILAPAGTAPADVLVERFLGRPFNAAAWRASLGGGR